ncbi:MAG: thiamine diphosphokinase [Spirochaetia bacterium]|nr:thiamine diphosphokinase [Spirochaetia bacterium]
MLRGLIITGGAIPEKDQLYRLEFPYTCIIAADSGYDNAVILGLAPDIVLGDFDSIKHKPVSGSEVIPFPSDKDYTDTELALMELHSRNISIFDMVGGGEGRLDHTLALLSVFSSPEYPQVWITGREIVYAVVPGEVLRVSVLPGTAVSLFTPRGEEAVVTTSGLFWELDSFQLSKTRASISNRTINDTITVKVLEGSIVLVSVVLPGIR